RKVACKASHDYGRLTSAICCSDAVPCPWAVQDAVQGCFGEEDKLSKCSVRLPGALFCVLVVVPTLADGSPGRDLLDLSSVREILYIHTITLVFPRHPGKRCFEARFGHNTYSRRIAMPSTHSKVAYSLEYAGCTILSLPPIPGPLMHRAP
ncbi:unnamed protein product, partial [Scytosiphon promiscuus]